MLSFIKHAMCDHDISYLMLYYIYLCECILNFNKENAYKLCVN